MVMPQTVNLSDIGSNPIPAVDRLLPITNHLFKVLRRDGRVV